ncbi:branched-chain amino acid ABC transporter substrate-binding protein [Candidatus Ichthyocystis sparus]|uniref:branched-chain amino acid ABC transporter substrate-binding protein n=1 Tax=Candidatus Ichthyocystis sparus TaxID=1561004 RepID=UPI000B87B581|nr:branched-chain amino acid ABC transporter substrate-binding protein [Candidatus Ichthyocystis sparus]
MSRETASSHINLGHSMGFTFSSPDSSLTANKCYALASLALLLLFAACNSPSLDSIRKEKDLQKTVVLIGFSGPLTGNAAHIGADYQNGINLAISDMNKENPSIDGHPLVFRLLSQNDRGDPRTATTAASFLVDKNIIAVIGHVDSGCTIASSSIYHKANIIQIAPSVSNQKYTQQGFDNTLRMMSPDTLQGEAIAKYVTETVTNPSVAIIDDGSSYGQNLSNQVEYWLKNKGIELIAHEYTYRDKVDYAAILARINKTKANVLFFSGTDTQAASIISQERIMNPKMVFFTGDMACTPRFVLLAGKKTEGTICSRNSLPFDEVQRVIEFRKRYESTFSVPMQPYAVFSYDAAKIIGETIIKTGSLNKEKLISYLHKEEFTGLTGKIAFKRNGDPKYPNITVFMISGGKFQVQKIYSKDYFSCTRSRHESIKKK